MHLKKREAIGLMRDISAMLGKVCSASRTSLQALDPCECAESLRASCAACVEKASECAYYVVVLFTNLAVVFSYRRTDGILSAGGRMRSAKHITLV